MPIRKNFEFYDLFNYQIMKIKESGILHYIRQSYGDGGMNRKCESTKRQKGTPIDLYTFITPVLVLFVSFIASFIILIAEICLNYVNKQKQQNNINSPYTGRPISPEEHDISQLSVQSVSS